MRLHRALSRAILAACIISAPPVAYTQINVEYLHSFGTTNSIGTLPGPLVRGSNGVFFGATESGVPGSNGFGGTIYGLDTNGANPRMVFKFGDLAGGSTTQYRLVAGSDGAIYAFNHTVGSSTDGGLVKVQPDGGGFQVLLTAAAVQTRTWQQMIEASDGLLYAFAGTKIVRVHRDGTGFESIHTDTSPFTVSSASGVSDQLLEGSDGMLYVSQFGTGSGGRGLVFRINKDGTGRTNVLDFANLAPEMGSSPHQLIQGSDGALYGVAVSTSGNGSPPATGSPVFRMNPDGTGYQVIANLTNYLVAGPAGTLREGGTASAFFEGADGLLYGATQTGGTNRAGLVFRVARDGSGFTNLLEFPASYLAFDSGAGVNRSPGKFLVEGVDGRIHGSMRENAVFRFPFSASDFETVYDFPPSTTSEGTNVTCSLTLASDGALYGTAVGGGSDDNGVVFKVRTNGLGFAVIKSFVGTNDGTRPYGGVTEGSDGKLYGTLQSGGDGGYGSVFRLDKDGGGFAVLRHFQNTGADGRIPKAALLEASDGALYGTTYVGGGTAAGTIFKLNKDGSGYQTLHRFTNGVSGAAPSARLLEGSDGRLYGTTELAGPQGSAGVVFALNKTGSGFVVVRTFPPTPTVQLRTPRGGLVQAGDGALYGTASAGGIGGFGGLFKVNPDGSGYQIVRAYSATGGDGRQPAAGLTFGADGLLYGSTQFGGGSVNGSLFRVNTNGTGYEKLYGFGGQANDGGNPVGTLALGSDGTLYGTTSTGGGLNFGTVFRVTFSDVAPRLALASDGIDGLELSWPQSAAAFRLQTNPDLDNAAGWQAVSNAPVLVNGSFTLPIVPTNSAGFFRLIK